MRVLVVGKKESGFAAQKLLNANGFDVVLVDDCDGLSFNEKSDLLSSGLLFVVISPGVSLVSDWVRLAKKNNVEVIGELELSFRYLKGTICAITGTNGKTTTTTLLGELLKTMGKTFVGGNIGVAASNFAQKTTKKDYIALEVSSFQLESIKSFKPHIAALLNITPDHLNRHKTMKNYIKTKFKIFKNMTKYDFAVINADSEVIMKNLSKIRANKFYFSTENEVRGCYLKNDFIYFKDDNKTIPVCPKSSIRLVGEHNLSNALAAILIFILAGGDYNLVKGVLENFYGVSHRLEFVTSINSVKFYNDSKSTNPDSTMVAIKSFSEPLILLLGGSDKGIDLLDLMRNLPKNVIKIIAFGQVNEKIMQAAKTVGLNNLIKANSVKDATLLAFNLASSGDVVLFSPGFASFDEFSNFEERGRFFVKVVKEIKDATCAKNNTKKTNQPALKN